ncbi:Metal chaperone, involved in Zn homeostasis [hydrothermal vent metagenome]|uniref:Metal chaperone, involved in Zn homeostasis n=1 Tax=hydrothermal vent metagenome TaxID=652676 RepID=A0A3B0XQA9_9ZZZZ
MFKNIPTNIISGFLGAGKTTAIQALLKQKPASENWAVIVNEFGKVGIDGALLKNDEVEIKEIPGGCLCCVGSQSLSVGLNNIIRNVKPHRIIIEPTGLGHPKKLIDTLTGEFYQSVLDLKAIINLLDARNLNDERYTTNESFIDQVNLADILIGSKSDTYSENDKYNFMNYASQLKPAKTKVVMLEQGQLKLQWLDLTRLKNRAAAFAESHQHAKNETEISTENNTNWFIVDGFANGYSSVGWKINKVTRFSEKTINKYLSDVFEQTSTERIKGVVFTDKGWLSINCTRLDRQIIRVDEQASSILEIISSSLMDSEKLNKQLKKCVVKTF